MYVFLFVSKMLALFLPVFMEFRMKMKPLKWNDVFQKYNQAISKVYKIEKASFSRKYIKN